MSRPLLFQTYTLLDQRQKKSSILLLFLMLFSSVIEALGIGILFPLLLLLSDGTTEGSKLLRELAEEWTGITDPAYLVLAVLWGFAVFSLIKSAFVVWVAWCQSVFVADLQMSLSTRLFRGYLREPWSFHLNRNSAELMRNVYSETTQVTLAVQSILSVVTELMLVLATILVLLFIEPLGMIISCTILALAATAFYTAIKHKLLAWGHQRQLHLKELTKHLQQGLGGAKDIILLNRVEHFVRCFHEHSSATALIQRKVLLTQNLPRHWLELLGAIALTILVTVMLLRGMPLSSVIPTVGIFAAAAFRLMPSINRFMQSFQSIKFIQPSVETVVRELKDGAAIVHVSSQELDCKQAIRLDQVTFSYDSNPAPALKDISLEILPGQSVGLVGGSGAGKSTLVDILLGLLTPTQGRVLVDNTPITENLQAWQKTIGYVPQTIYLTDDTLRRNVAFGMADNEIDEARVRRAIEMAQLSAFVDSLPDGLETVVGERGVRLSGGQRQRIGIARALYNNPNVLVLDEATSALDNATEAEVMESIKALQGQRTIVIVAHRLTTVAHCDQIYRFEKGQLVDSGSAEDVIQRLSVSNGSLQ